MKPPADVVAEFDAIAHALAASPPHDALTPAERFLLRRIPRHARRALDVGCGDGRLARAAARRGIAVLGLDASPAMVALARSRTDAALSVDYRVADAMREPLPAAAFDVVMTVNVAHHLPLDALVPRLAAAVAPGGVLLIQDLTTRRGVRWLPLNALAGLVRRLRRLAGRERVAPRVAALYAAHGVGEEYLTPDEAARVYTASLPGARVWQHLDWRYTMIWRRVG